MPSSDSISNAVSRDGMARPQTQFDTACGVTFKRSASSLCVISGESFSLSFTDPIDLFFSPTRNRYNARCCCASSFLEWASVGSMAGTLRPEERAAAEAEFALLRQRFEKAHGRKW